MNRPADVIRRHWRPPRCVHQHPPLRRRLAPVLALPVTLLLAATLVPAAGQAPESPNPDTFEFSFQGEGHDHAGVEDFRDGSVAATAGQKAAAKSLGATTVRWNDFGTPHVMYNQQGYLSGPRSGKAADVARGFVSDHSDLFKLSADQVAALEVVTDSPLLDTPDLARERDGKAVRNPDVAHVVTFRQTFGDLAAGHDGLLTVGVQRDGRVGWVSSSVTGDEDVAGSRNIDAAEAIAASAEGVHLELGQLTSVEADGPWTTFEAAGSQDLQRARQMAMPTPTAGVRLVWETTILKADHTDHEGHSGPAAYISFVDAETGKVLLRDNRVDHLVNGMTMPTSAPSAQPFAGATDDAGACTPQDQRHGPVTAEEGTGQISVAASATVPNGTDDDITINLYRDGEANPVASQDLLTSPEVLTWGPNGGVPAGDYFVEICEFTPSAGSISYTGSVTTGPATSADPAMPRWRVFEANPNFTDSSAPGADTRSLWCWVSDSAACDDEVGNIASRLPWDVLPPSLASLTSMGNNATTAISEVSFRSPDTVFKRPVSPDRRYDYPWKNTWYESSCDPKTFDQPGGNDDDASVTNLFVSHNRMHDWSYFLGFTERNSNLQQSNFGNTGPTRENDPEVGNAQSGRRTFNGRDNANQITLQDGIAPITNQYLWQPLAGAFYAACTDGAYDMAVVAHEYGHAISNRMIAGPDTGTGATQGQSESWSDLVFAEYFRGNGISTGEGANPLALAPYVSGNKERGIRNYAMNQSPLTYADLGYDGNGSESPHADGEIWSAANHDIVVALNQKYDGQFPSSDKALQLRCAEGALPADECPGNRRWAQIMFDGFLLNPAGSTMLDSRDAMLAADLLRFDGANQAELWDAFAKRGMGETAYAANVDDRDPVPGWSSPVAKDEATVEFRSAADKTTVYTGVYEARVTPTADNDPETETGSTVSFVPGRYEFLAQAPGHGAVRFSRTLKPGQNVVIDVPLRRNLASATNGATATGDGINLEALIDDSEATNWASLESAGTASQGRGEGQQVQGRQVTVKIGDQPVRINKVQVSAALRPTDPDNADSGSQSRFSALRSFDILVCDATVNGNTCTDDEAEFSVAYRSAADAFPGVRPRPTAPDLLLRSFGFRGVKATHVRIRVRDNQCTGGPAYQGDTNPSNDPVFSNPDCDSEETTPDRAVLSPPKEQVRIAELQVFGPTS
ncbi:M36 family metallopeptidase [Nocardioides coralli]|uniref:M36 family metallopeptidase n=1 Tax=Nocardioides coralli TaxID=2872154 RepID=UPI001CA3AD70|nr:M36 family metallopeptidase [Nocardioides coralli]QZY28579.1 M36 family metallopeptidase [Nocardioides coralli]